MSKLKSTVYLGVARLLSAAINVISVPLYLKWIGGQYGLVVLLYSIAQYCALIGDPGLSSAIQHRLVENLESGHEEQARVIAESHVVAMFVSGLLALALHAVLFFTIVSPEMSHDGQKAAFFLLSGASVMFSVGSLGYVTYLASVNRFVEIAKANTAVAVLVSLFGIALVYWFRHAWGFAAAAALAQGVLYFMLRRSSLRLGLMRSVPKFSWSDYQPSFRFASRAFFTNIGTALTTVDTIYIRQMLGDKLLGAYGAATRIPGIMASSMPLAQVYQPDFAREKMRGEEAYQRAYERNTKSALAIALGFLVVPTAFGEPILRLWLGSEFLDWMPWILVGGAVVSAFNIYGSTFAMAAFGKDRPGLVVPFVFYVALAVVTLTWPILGMYGLIGLTVFRAFLQVSQMWFLDATAKRHLVPGLNLGRHFGEKVLIVAAAAGVWGLGFWLESLPALKSSPWGSVALVPVWVYGFLMVLFRTRLVEPPAQLRRFFPGS